MYLSRLISSSLHSNHHHHRRLLPPLQSYFSTSPTRRPSRRRTKADDESPLSPEDVAQLGFRGVAVNQEEDKMEVVEFITPPPRPSTIPFEPKVANFVQLVGNIGDPVRLTNGANQTVFSLLVKEKNNAKYPRIPIIFEDGLSQVAACYLKKNDLVYVAGQLIGDFDPFKSNDGQANIQVSAHELCYVNNECTQHDNQFPQYDNHMVYEKKPVISKASGATSSGKGTKKEGIEKLWSDLVDNPTDWVDNRTDKKIGSKNPKYPDFKQKNTKEPLWLNTAPDWVLEKLGSLVFHTSYNTVKRGNMTFGKKTETGYNFVAGNFGKESSALSDKKTDDEDSWKDLIENPKKWWDNRSNKFNPKSPDFKHKDLGTALWVRGAPKWAVAKLPPLVAQEKKTWTRGTLPS